MRPSPWQAGVGQATAKQKPANSAIWRASRLLGIPGAGTRRPSATFCRSPAHRECWIPVAFPALVSRQRNCLRHFRGREKAQAPPKARHSDRTPGDATGWNAKSPCPSPDETVHGAQDSVPPGLANAGSGPAADTASAGGGRLQPRCRTKRAHHMYTGRTALCLAVEQLPPSDTNQVNRAHSGGSAKRVRV
jgi:hypothetical protein